MYKCIRAGTLFKETKSPTSVFFPNRAFQYISDIYKATDKFNSFVQEYKKHDPQQLPDINQGHTEEQIKELVKEDVELASYNYDFIKKYKHENINLRKNMKMKEDEIDSLSKNPLSDDH